MQGELLRQADDVEHLQARHSDHVVLEFGAAPRLRLHGQPLHGELVALEDDAFHTAVVEEREEGWGGGWHGGWRWGRKNSVL